MEPQCVRPADLVTPRPDRSAEALGPTKQQACGPRCTARPQRACTCRPRWITDDRRAADPRAGPAHPDVRRGHRLGSAAVARRGVLRRDDRGGYPTLPVPLVAGSTTSCGRTRAIQISQAQLAPSERTHTGGIWVHDGAAGTLRRHADMREIVAPGRRRHGHGGCREADLGPPDGAVRRRCVRRGPAYHSCVEALVLAIEREPVHPRRRDAAGLGASTLACRRRYATCRCSPGRGSSWAIPTCSMSRPAPLASTTATTTRTASVISNDVAREKPLPRPRARVLHRGRRRHPRPVDLVVKRMASPDSGRGSTHRTRRWTLEPPPWWPPGRRPRHTTSLRIGAGAPCSYDAEVADTLGREGRIVPCKRP